MTSRDDLVRHLSYYRDIGVQGISRDPAWRERSQERRA